MGHGGGCFIAKPIGENMDRIQKFESSGSGGFREFQILNKSGENNFAAMLNCSQTYSRLATNFRVAIREALEEEWDRGFGGRRA